jgi:hypothetical protein
MLRDRGEGRSPAGVAVGADGEVERVLASDHGRAAGEEIARVCRPGGRIGLTLMPRDSRAGELFARLDEPAAAELRAEFLALRERFDGRPRTYVLVLGGRR